jgi:DNA-dependent RNA polymerase auxiliary subunit epsilon
MPKYYVGLSVLNVFEVEADNDFDAEEKVRDLSLEDTLHDADYNITYIELIDE